MNKVCLIILDGVGHNSNRNDAGDATRLAGMKNFERIKKESFAALIKASGKEVGLPSEKDAGNSEVGHNAMGAGQFIKQGLALIDEQIKKDETFENAVFKQMVRSSRDGKKLHIIGLVSDGRVHSDIAHLFEILKQLKKQDAKNIKIHALIDGRDVPPQSAPHFLKMLEDEIKHLKLDATIADVAGRDYLVMDRYETNLEIIRRSFGTYVLGEGRKTKDIYKQLRAIYATNPGITDENIEAFVLDDKGQIDNGDGVLLFNYRGDRALELSDMFDNFKYVDSAKERLDKCIYMGMTQYDGEANLPKNYLIVPPRIDNTLTQWLCGFGVRQYSVTESVKFGHLTYYFNGNRREPFDKKLEKWTEIKTKVAIYSTTPKMQAGKIADDLIEKIDAGAADFYKVNLSNGDMVGHTGDLAATIAACKEADEQLGRIYEACRKNKVTVVVTADHGNAEEMLDAKGGRNTKHSANKVWVAINNFSGAQKFKLKKGNFGLTNIAATICVLMSLPVSQHFNEALIEQA